MSTRKRSWYAFILRIDRITFSQNASIIFSNKVRRLIIIDKKLRPLSDFFTTFEVINTLSVDTKTLVKVEIRVKILTHQDTVFVRFAIIDGAAPVEILTLDSTLLLRAIECFIFEITHTKLALADRGGMIRL